MVKQDSYSDIQNLADFMKEYRQTTTVLEGHTDLGRHRRYNQRLSERRANAVRRVLVDEPCRGQSRERRRLWRVSPGRRQLTEEGRAINRRVEAEVEARP